jgi:hypothetical protein
MGIVLGAIGLRVMGIVQGVSGIARAVMVAVRRPIGLPVMGIVREVLASVARAQAARVALMGLAQVRVGHVP